MEKAQELGFPVVMKIHSQDILHKTEANGVHLNLRNGGDVRDAFERIMASARAFKPEARIEGVTIQPMIEHPDYELILGAKRDRDFGPVILFGMGGIMAEVLKDQAITLPPLNRLLARRVMEETKVYRMLRGYRNRPPANLDLLEEILIRLAQLVTDVAEIEELDINPLILMGNEACAVDARVILKPSHVPAPFHLVISSYPNHHETHMVSEGGVPCFIRPIRPEDAPLLEGLFDTLSPQSVYFRFFGPLKALPHTMLARFTQIDYDREIALIALNETASQEQMLGVARLIRNPAARARSSASSWVIHGTAKALRPHCSNAVLPLPKSRESKRCGESSCRKTLGCWHWLVNSDSASTEVLGPGRYELKIDLRKL